MSGTNDDERRTLPTSTTTNTLVSSPSFHPVAPSLQLTTVTRSNTTPSPVARHEVAGCCHHVRDRRIRQRQFHLLERHIHLRTDRMLPVVLSWGVVSPFHLVQQLPFTFSAWVSRFPQWPDRQHQRFSLIIKQHFQVPSNSSISIQTACISHTYNSNTRYVNFSYTILGSHRHGYNEEARTEARHKDIKRGEVWTSKLRTGAQHAQGLCKGSRPSSLIIEAFNIPVALAETAKPAETTLDPSVVELDISHHHHHLRSTRFWFSVCLARVLTFCR